MKHLRVQRVYFRYNLYIIIRTKFKIKRVKVNFCRYILARLPTSMIQMIHNHNQHSLSQVTDCFSKYVVFMEEI